MSDNKGYSGYSSYGFSDYKPLQEEKDKKDDHAHSDHYSSYESSSFSSSSAFPSSTFPSYSSYSSASAPPPEPSIEIKIPSFSSYSSYEVTQEDSIPVPPVADITVPIYTPLSSSPSSSWSIPVKSEDPAPAPEPRPQPAASVNTKSAEQIKAEEQKKRINDSYADYMLPSNYHNDRQVLSNISAQKQQQQQQQQLPAAQNGLYQASYYNGDSISNSKATASQYYNSDSAIHWANCCGPISLLIFTVAFLAPAFQLSQQPSIVSFLCYACIFPFVVAIPLMCIFDRKVMMKTTGYGGKFYRICILLWFAMLVPCAIAGSWYLNKLYYILPENMGSSTLANVTSVPQQVVSITDAALYRIHTEYTNQQKVSSTSKGTTYFWVAPIWSVSANLTITLPLPNAYAVSDVLTTKSIDRSAVNEWQSNPIPNTVWKKSYSGDIVTGINNWLRMFGLPTYDNAPVVTPIQIDAMREKVSIQTLCAILIPGCIYALVWLIYFFKVLKNDIIDACVS